MVSLSIPDSRSSPASVSDFSKRPAIYEIGSYGLKRNVDWLYHL